MTTPGTVMVPATASTEPSWLHWHPTAAAQSSVDQHRIVVTLVTHDLDPTRVVADDKGRCPCTSSSGSHANQILPGRRGRVSVLPVVPAQSHHAARLGWTNFELV